MPAKSGAADSLVKRGPLALDFELPPARLCNGTALRKATRRVSQLYDAAIAPCGLRSTQRSILAQIARTGAPSMGELAEALVLDRSALAHNLKPLERDGLVSMAVDPEDRRSRRVVLTEAGLARLRDSMDLWRKAQQQFEAAFGDAAAADLRRTLERVAALNFDQT